MDLQWIIAQILLYALLAMDKHGKVICARQTGMELSIEHLSHAPQLNLELDLDADLEPLSRSIEQQRQSRLDVSSNNNQLQDVHACPAGYLRFKNSCYHVVETNGEMTWDIANTYCQLRGSHLVEIQSEAEQAFIESLVQTKKENSAYWIGATNRKGKGLWEWSSKPTPVEYNLWISHWSSWAYEVDSGSCAILDTSESYQWMFWPCQNNFYMAGKKHDEKTGIGFICEQSIPRYMKKVRHRHNKRRRRHKKKGRRARRRRRQKIIAQTLLSTL